MTQPGSVQFEGSTPHSAAHAVFQTLELLSEIFSFCNYNDLPACAITCRFWEIPALFQVWEDINNIVVLLNTLGEMEVNDDGLYICEEPIDLDLWARFERYASMIKILDCDMQNVDCAYEMLDQISLFSALRKTQDLFPRLRHLSYSADDHGSWPRGFVLMPPGLTSLNLAISSHAFSPGWELGLRLLPNHVPLLTEFTLICGDGEQLLTASHHISQIFRSLKYITKVHMDSSIVMEPSIWEALSSSKTLVTLHIAPDSDELNGPEPRVHFNEGDFPELDTLILTGSPSEIANLFSFTAPKNLESVVLVLADVTNANEVGKCISMVASHCHRLLEFTIHHTANKVVIGLDHIRPLLSQHHLQLLRLAVPFNFLDKNIEQIAIAFPNLVSLQLTPINTHISHPIPPPTLTLNALMPLAQHCTSLDNLVIYVQGTALPFGRLSRKHAYAKFASLTTLNFGYSTVPGNDDDGLDLLGLIFFLAAICAEATSIGSSDFGQSGIYQAQPTNNDDHQWWLDLAPKVAMTQVMIVHAKEVGKREERLTVAAAA